MGLSAEILIHVPRERKHITGEPITGIVKFRLDKDTVYKNIAISLLGKGLCQWQATHNTVITTTETIFADKMYLLDNVTDEAVKLSAGSHEFPFEILVPENVPPSVKTTIGEIKYHLILKFKRPEFLTWNKVYKSKITIYPRIDSELTDQPVTAALNKTLCKCFSSKNQDISLETILEREYLTPGGDRNISFVVTNNSDKMLKVKTELLCKTNYTIPKRNKKVSKRKVIRASTVETPKIPNNCVSNMTNIIPVALDICTVRHSNIINREYKIRVTLKLPMPHSNVSVEIPVFVGEECIEEGLEAGEFREPMGAPPSYWESMFEDRENAD